MLGQNFCRPRKNRSWITCLVEVGDRFARVIAPLCPRATKRLDVQPKQPTDEIRQSRTMVGLTVGDHLLRPEEAKRFGDFF